MWHVFLSQPSIMFSSTRLVQVVCRVLRDRVSSSWQDLFHGFALCKETKINAMRNKTELPLQVAGPFDYGKLRGIALRDRSIAKWVKEGTDHKTLFFSRQLLIDISSPTSKKNSVALNPKRQSQRIILFSIPPSREEKKILTTYTECTGRTISVM